MARLAVGSAWTAARMGALRRMLPEGRALDEDVWLARHRLVVALVLAHVVAIPGFAVLTGHTFAHGLLEAGFVAAGAVAAMLPRASRGFRSSAASMGLLTASAVLVHLSGGFIEMHFHFFVMIAVIAFYQSWTPFLVAIGFVVVEHGALGVLDPASVYNHPDAIAHPWIWAAIHAVFVLGAAVASLTAWRLSERATTRLAESEERARRTASVLAATLESTADGILVVDREGRITSMNQQFATMWRIPAHVLATHDDNAALQTVFNQLKQPEAFLAKVRELYAQPEAESFDVLEFKDGRVFERYSKPQRIGGTLAGRVWSFRDVTERRRAEGHALEVERLKTLDKFKTAFINMAAHELGTPLTPIKVQVHMLKRSAALGRTDRVAHDLEVLERNVNRLVKLVGDVLDGARAQAAQLKIRPSAVDLGHVMLDAVESFLRPAEEAGLRIEVEPSGDLPVQADAARISQVLYNFLSNAVKFTPSGGCIRVTSERVGDRGIVRVADTGPGLSAEQLERLFQPFSQVHEPQQVTAAGTGLGLYISRSIVEQHGGRIWAESEGPGHGSCFVLELPLAPALPPVAEPDRAPPTR